MLNFDKKEPVNLKYVPALQRQIDFNKLTEEELTEDVDNLSHSLSTFALHIHEITHMRPKEIRRLGFGPKMSVKIYCEFANNLRDDPEWNQYYFSINGGAKIWVGNRYGAFNAYSMLWVRHNEFFGGER